MDASKDKERFDAMLAATGIPIEALTPRMGLELLLRFYAENPAGVTLYGVWSKISRYGPEELGFRFQWHRTRSEDRGAFASADVSLLFKVGPQSMAGDLRGFRAWCAGPEQMADFRSAVETSDAIRVWGDSPSAGVRVLWDDIIQSHVALFDCWGFRDPSRPVVTMTEDQWLQSDDVPLMLRWFRQEWQGEEADLDRLLQSYLLACCRRIWELLPLDASRRGVEIAERDLEGEASREEVARARYEAEGAAFYLDPSDDREPPADLPPDFKEAWAQYELKRRADINRLAEEVKVISSEKLKQMVRSASREIIDSPRELLESAAYFAEASMIYPGLRPKESIERYQNFLPASLLREMVGNPFRERPSASS
ncbi:hypothetical protein OJF2_73520 [Aquisphaera giovannonii]|uniref:Uncharacterized protein n=1 Tax=Aquisphaera giovannonii TaxID=406548 RepID=A0A5B9WDP6_9BACT|nr:hypothetical protein [Aquisphaera giovannonii]QEH38746.1 hypothetical protein OJF2_73520 [Aquisphaera giovannonii]